MPLIDNDAVLQLMYDRECADVIGYCRKCGHEIYAGGEDQDGLCYLCWERGEEDDDG